MQVKVQRDTKVVIQMDVIEAGKIMSLLLSKVDFAEEKWAGELYDSLSNNEVIDVPYTELETLDQDVAL